MMAVEIDQEGKQTVGGIAAIRDAFVAAGRAKLHCNKATMTYGAGNTQVLHFAGMFSDGRSFDTSTIVEPGGALAAAAEKAALALLMSDDRRTAMTMG